MTKPASTRLQPSFCTASARPPQGPGEFTRAFQLPSANVPAQRPPDPVASSGPVKTPRAQANLPEPFRFPVRPFLRLLCRIRWPAVGLRTCRRRRPPARGSLRSCFGSPARRAEGNQQTARPPELGLPPSPPDIHPPTAPPAAAPAGEFTRLFRTQPSPNPPGDFSGSSGAPKQNFPSPELPPEPAAPRMNIATGPGACAAAERAPGAEGSRRIHPSDADSVTANTAPPQPPASPSPASAQAVQIPISVTPLPCPPVPSMPSVPAPQRSSCPQASIPVPQAPSIQAPSIQAPSVQVPAPAAPRSGISPAILLLGGLILVAVILVLIFALRR